MGVFVKKPVSEYTVQHVGTRVLDDFRGDRVTGSLFKVTKFTPSTNDITEYEVVLSTIGDFCSCPAGMHHAGDCKHLKMVREWRTTHGNDEGRDPDVGVAG